MRGSPPPPRHTRRPIHPASAGRAEQSRGEHGENKKNVLTSAICQQRSDAMHTAHRRPALLFFSRRLSRSHLSLCLRRHKPPPQPPARRRSPHSISPLSLSSSPPPPHWPPPPSTHAPPPPHALHHFCSRNGTTLWGDSVSSQGAVLAALGWAGWEKLHKREAEEDALTNHTKWPCSDCKTRRYC